MTDDNAETVKMLRREQDAIKRLLKSTMSTEDICVQIERIVYSGDTSGAPTAFQQATIELAALAGPRTRSIDMEYNHFHHEVGDDRTELTWTVSIMDDQHKWRQWSAPTLDEAMTAARAALRPVAVGDAVAAADGVMG